ncbi:MAG: phosphopantothenoylcysteine decarboxylase, partial [Oscillospiraceae bacterium]|nr:phosphopantothenoylcysteine decarboxylase [Oscillospiraceae bacterium]
MEALNGRCVVLGVTGGIAAYKMASVASALHKAGADVRVVMTRNATEIIPKITFATLNNHRCLRETFALDFQNEVA